MVQITKKTANISEYKVGNIEWCQFCQFCAFMKTRMSNGGMRQQVLRPQKGRWFLKGVLAKNLYRCNWFVIGPQGPAAAASSVWNTNRAQINSLDPRDPLVPTTLFEQFSSLDRDWEFSLSLDLSAFHMWRDVGSGFGSWRLKKTLHSFQKIHEAAEVDEFILLLTV